MRLGKSKLTEMHEEHSHSVALVVAPAQIVALVLQLPRGDSEQFAEFRALHRIEGMFLAYEWSQKGRRHFRENGGDPTDITFSIRSSCRLALSIPCR